MIISQTKPIQAFNHNLYSTQNVCERVKSTALQHVGDICRLESKTYSI